MKPRAKRTANAPAAPAAPIDLEASGERPSRTELSEPAEGRTASGPDADDLDPTGMARRVLSQFARVLVVDDDDALRRSLSRLLRAGQSQVSEAKTVAEGVDLLAREPELVITDVRLPDGSGRRVVELARQRRPPPLVVAMSGLASAREAFALAQSGARIYLTKPFAQQELLDGLADYCSEARAPAPAPLDNDLTRNLQEFARRYAIPEREMALVHLATAGVPRARCPEMLGVSENTCKTLTRRLLQRCGARNLAQIPRLVLMGETAIAEA
jgi:DNA-binding NarL/FixJ family response regulator